MKTIDIISQKGGAGKTTLAVHLAAAAAGHVSAIIDLDPQATAASWGDRRQAAEPEVISGQAVRLPALMKTARATMERIFSCWTQRRTPTKPHHSQRGRRTDPVPRCNF